MLLARNVNFGTIKLKKQVIFLVYCAAGRLSMGIMEEKKTLFKHSKDSEYKK